MVQTSASRPASQERYLVKLLREIAAESGISMTTFSYDWLIRLEKDSLVRHIHGYNFELSVYSRADLLKTKDDLLITKQVQSKNYRVASSHEDVDSEYKEV